MSVRYVPRSGNPPQTAQQLGQGSPEQGGLVPTQDREALTGPSPSWTWGTAQ